MPAPPPYNFYWSGNTLTYDLASGVDGVDIQYKKENTQEWLPIYYCASNPQTSCTLVSSLGPIGELKVKSKDQGEGWGEEAYDEIVHHVAGGG